MVILVSMIPRNVKASHRFDHLISSIAKGCHSTSVEKARIRIPSISKAVGLEFLRYGGKFRIEEATIQRAVDESPGELSDEDEDDDICPVECVKEFKTDEEFTKILEKAKETKTLVVVDFYRRKGFHVAEIFLDNFHVAEKFRLVNN